MEKLLEFTRRFFYVWIALLLLAIYINFFSKKMKQFDGQGEQRREFRRMKGK